MDINKVLENHALFLLGRKDGARANLLGADLREADLRGANLGGANLRGADLRGGDLRGADIDFSSWPLWCGSAGVWVDARIARQLAAHFCALVSQDHEVIAAQDKLRPFAKESHRASNLNVK